MSIRVIDSQYYRWICSLKQHCQCPNWIWSYVCCAYFQNKIFIASEGPKRLPHWDSAAEAAASSAIAHSFPLQIFRLTFSMRDIHHWVTKSFSLSSLKLKFSMSAARSFSHRAELKPLHSQEQWNAIKPSSCGFQLALSPSSQMKASNETLWATGDGRAISWKELGSQSHSSSRTKIEMESVSGQPCGSY